MKNLKPKIHIIAQELFQYSLMLYLIFLIVEMFKEGFISYFFNLNILLGVVLISGSVMVLTYTQLPEENTINKITINEIVNIFFIAGVGALLVYFQMLELGVIAYVTAGTTFIIISLLSYLILSDSEKETTEK